MARCPHGFERSAVPCSVCGDAATRPAVSRRRVPQRRNKPDGARLPRPPHPSYRDLTGETFCGAVVLERAENNRRGTACWRIRLPCGHEKTLASIELRQRRTRWNCTECRGAA